MVLKFQVSNLKAVSWRDSNLLAGAAQLKAGRSYQWNAMVSPIVKSSPWCISLRQLRWRHTTGILPLPCWFDADRRSWSVLSKVQSLGKYLWMMSCYPIGRFLLSTSLKLSNGKLIAEKVSSLVRLKYVYFCYTNSRAFQEPHRKQDIWLTKSQCNLNVIIYRTNKSSERVKLTGEWCTWHTLKLRLYGGRFLYIVDPFVHAKSWQQRSCILWFSRLYLVDSARQPKVYGEKMTRFGGWPCHRIRVTQLGGSPLLPNQLFVGL